MENLKTEFNRLKKGGFKKQSEYAFRYFDEKYGGKDVDSRLIETDLYENKARNPIAGKVYMWDYDPITKDRLSYYDTRPLVFVMDSYVAEGTGNLITRGINLHFVPPDTRLRILERFREYFDSYIKKELEMIAKGQRYQRPKKIKGFMDYLASGITDSVYSFAFRSYIVPRIGNKKIVEYEDWKLVPFLEPKDFVGITPSQAYKLFKSGR